MPQPLFFIVLIGSLYGSLKFKEIYSLSSLYDFGLGLILFGFTALTVLFEYRALII